MVFVFVEKVSYWIAYIVTKILLIICPPFKKYARKKVQEMLDNVPQV